MNMISQLPQPARFESVGERRLPVQVPIVTYTLAERVQNALTENAMIEEGKRLNEWPTLVAPESVGSPVAANAANLAKGDAKRARLLELIDGPSTVRELAERMGVTTSNVRDMLSVLHDQGKVAKAGKSPKVHRGGIADIWVRA